MTMCYPKTADHWHPNGVEIEVHDHVILSLDCEPGIRDPGVTQSEFEGQITKIFPRLAEVRVRYSDHMNCNRHGDPVTRSVRVSIDRVMLERRDG